MDAIIELREQYGKVRKYLEDEWKEDPENEPYRSKYKAMEYLKSMKALILETIDKSTVSDNCQLQGMLAVVYLLMGTISIDTEELSPGQTFLNNSLLVIPQESDPRYILISLNAKNQLGILYTQRGEFEEAQVHLENSERLYKAFVESGLVEKVISFHEHFEAKNEVKETLGHDELEKTHTLTMFYLAQVYGKLGDTMKSATYCHETLLRQLECKQYDAIDWALNAVTLSQFFMERKLFCQARHHLAAASFMLDQHEDSLKSLDSSESEVEGKKEELRYRRADVSRCWAKFGIFLLEESKKELNDDIVLISENISSALQLSRFSTLELSEYENEMTDTLVIDFESARDLMLVTQKHLNIAKEYYSLEDHASDYAQIIQDHSQLLKHLSEFETDHSRLCKMMKKRINMLEDTIKELNPQYYLAECRALWFELGRVYHDLMHQKQTFIRESGDTPNPAALAKANHLAERSILFFQHFLESVKSKQTHEFPSPIPDVVLRPTLVAHFYLGRLYYKLITPDKRQHLHNTSTALECFKFLVDYCNNHENAAQVVSDELGVSQEMANLLQQKMKQMTTVVS